MNSDFVPDQASSEPSVGAEKTSGRGRASCALILALIILSLAFVDLWPYFQYKREYAKMTSLVTIGMDIDDAGTVLRAEGLDAGTKYHPTDNNDYYWLDVRLARRTPLSVLILRLMGADIRFFHYGCLEAGLDEKVRKIM